MDENEQDTKSPMKRLGSTRKLLVFNNIRLQLNEQLRCLDVRMEAQVSLLIELQDFFRRRGEVELEYSKNLDKLAKHLQLRHKEQKQKREQWPLLSSYSCWQNLLTHTKNLSRDHMALSEVYSIHLVARLGQVMEDVQRVYKRCREIGYETHEEILRVLHELHTTMKTFHSYQNDFRQTEIKLKYAENQRTKCESSLPPEKVERSKKYKLLEKEVQKRRKKYNDAKLKALKAKNEYNLCLTASNTTIHKYFVDDLSDLIDCMDFGFHHCISQALLMHVTAEEGRQKSVQSGLDAFSACINSLDSRLDKQRFLEFNHNAFMIPKKIEFQYQKGEDLIEEPPIEPEIKQQLHKDMESRLTLLQQRVTGLKTESDEVWKTLETTESTLLCMLTAKDYDCKGYFGDNAVPVTKIPDSITYKARADKQETEDFYLTKFREYLVSTSKLARLDAKQEYIRQSLSNDVPEHCQMVRAAAKTPRRKRIGRLPISGQPKLFGGSLEEYQEATNQQIPMIIKSCVRVINLYGLHHHGIFRVSGSQVEINNFKEWFERGEDPLADMTDASDINSVAGVLKLYLRELREPLFPIIYFEQFMQLAQVDPKEPSREFIVKMRTLMNTLSPGVLVVLRYLFAFLNHVSDYVDENMMDPYNLAICFGPSLLQVPDDKDQVQYQNLVNELIKNIIIYYDEIFPNDDNTLYEKFSSPNPDDQIVPPPAQPQDSVDYPVCPPEDDCESVEAVAEFDFNARSDLELSFKKGDTITIICQASVDWWWGVIDGKQGIIPDRYVSLKMKDDDNKPGILKSSSSEESVRRRASSSNDSDVSVAAAVVNSNAALVQCGPVTWTKDTATEVNANIGDKPPVLLQPPRENKPIDPGKTTPILPHRNLKTDEPKNTNPIENQPSNNNDQANPQPEIDETNVNFSQNRELWQRRANLNSLPSSPLLRAHRLSEPYMSRQSTHTPDLVMDLPLVPSTNGNEVAKPSSAASEGLFKKPEDATTPTETASIPDIESPDMQTAAETFAKQNQNTLKKNTKIQIDTSEIVAITSPMVERKYATLDNSACSTTTFKPVPKAKPSVRKKPALHVPICPGAAEILGDSDPPDFDT